MLLAELLRHDLVDLVLPRTCAGCDRPAALLCRGCRAALDGPLLGRTAPDPCPPGFPLLVAAARYEGPVRNALLAHKERGRLGVVRPLGALLARAVTELEPPVGALLVPVPSSRAAVRARGYDHALRLARAAGVGSGHRAAALLVSGRALSDSAGLTSTDRAANLAGALTARRRCDGASVVLVDDIATTGATLAEASRALRVAGAEVAGAVVVAATQRWRKSSRYPAVTLGNLG